MQLLLGFHTERDTQHSTYRNQCVVNRRRARWIAYPNGSWQWLMVLKHRLVGQTPVGKRERLLGNATMSELRSAAYWIGHLLSTLATIVGVYYAAIVGFDVALKLELIDSDLGTYYVAESMYQELDFNVENMESYLKKIEGKQYVFKEHIAGIQLNSYVFEAAKFSPSTFEIEPTLLSEVSKFYFAVGNALDVYYDSGQQSPQSLMSVVKKEVEHIQKQNTLTRLATFNKAIARSVEERGVSVERPEV